MYIFQGQSLHSRVKTKRQQNYWRAYAPPSNYSYLPSNSNSIQAAKQLPRVTRHHLVILLFLVYDYRWYQFYYYEIYSYWQEVRGKMHGRKMKDTSRNARCGDSRLLLRQSRPWYFLSSSARLVPLGFVLLPRRDFCASSRHRRRSGGWLEEEKDRDRGYLSKPVQRITLVFASGLRETRARPRRPWLRYTNRVANRILDFDIP